MRAAAAVFVLFACAALAAPPKLPSRVVRIPMWVEGKDPFHASDLKCAAAGARVLSIKGPSDDLMLLLVLDLTGDLSLVEPAKDALLAGINKLPARTWVSLLSAQDGLHVLVDPTAERAKITDAVQDLPVSGRAGLLDTVETAEKVADAVLNKSSVRVAVLYVTDSDISNYREDYTNPVVNSSDIHDLSRKFPESLIQEKISKMQARLAGRQSPLFIVHLNYRTERLNEAYQIGLKELAGVTGGAGVFCRSSAEIADAIQHTLDQICAHYSVTLALPERSNHSIQIQLEAAGKRTLTYRTRFDFKER